MSPAKHPHTTFTVGTTHAEIIGSPTLCLTKTRRLEPKISNVDQRTGFHRSNVHCSCFLAQASLFFLLVPFSSGFFAAIWHDGLIYTVSSKQLMLRCVCYLNSEEFIWASISEAGNSKELLLCSRYNSWSSFPVVVLMRASFIIVLGSFCDCTWRNFQSSWLTFMS